MRRSHIVSMFPSKQGFLCDSGNPEKALDKQSLARKTRVQEWKDRNSEKENNNLDRQWLLVANTARKHVPFLRTTLRGYMLRHKKTENDSMIR